MTEPLTNGLPGLRGTDHIGFTVPDLEQAVLRRDRRILLVKVIPRVVLVDPVQRGKERGGVLAERREMPAGEAREAARAAGRVGGGVVVADDAG